MVDSFSISLNSFIVVRGNSRPSNCIRLFDPVLDDMFFSKITHGSWYFFANYCCLHSFFEKKIKKSCNLISFCVISNMFHHKDKDKSFSGVNTKRPPWETGFPAKRVFLRNEFPCKICKFLDTSPSFK